MFEDIDFSNPETSAALEAAGFIPRDKVQELVTTENKRLEENKNSILEQYKEIRDKYNSLPISAEKLAEIAKDGRFKKIVESGFDKYEKSIAGEIGGQVDAVKTTLMMKEQDYLQEKRKYEDDLKKFQSENKKLRVENGLQIALNKFNDQIYISAVDDIKFRARNELDINEKGALIVKGENGVAKMTPDGPMTAEDWMKELKKTSPHYFKGANGAQHNHMLTGDLDTSNMTAKEKLALAMRSQK